MLAAWNTSRRTSTCGPYIQLDNRINRMGNESSICCGASKVLSNLCVHALRHAVDHTIVIRRNRILLPAKVMQKNWPNNEVRLSSVQKQNKLVRMLKHLLASILQKKCNRWVRSGRALTADARTSYTDRFKHGALTQFLQLHGRMTVEGSTSERSSASSLLVYGK